MDSPKIAYISITRGATEVLNKKASKLPVGDFFIIKKFLSLLDHPNAQAIPGKVAAAVGQLFKSYDQLVFFVSIGAVVRLIAPHLVSKETDPGVIAIDDKARFVIPMLSGHLGGANAFAVELATIFGGTAVMTTASEVGKTIAVDILGLELGWQVEAPKVNLVRVAAALVNKEPIAFVQEAGSRDWWKKETPLPKNIQLFETFSQVKLDDFAAVLWVTDQTPEPELWKELKERLVVYHPPAGQK